LRTLRMGSLLVVVAALAVLVAAVAAFGGTDQKTATAVAVAAGKPTEFRFTLSKRTVPKGLTTFRVTNRGTINHDFRIAGKKTPSLAAGKTATLRVTFRKAGRFAYMCTLPGHAAGGMRGILTVK
jgi:uncharacterized cupredoxin-like copper-binding protein